MGANGWLGWKHVSFEWFGLSAFVTCFQNALTSLLPFLPYCRATNPLESAPGTIRGDFCIEVGRNICHGSDSVENAEREIGLWFTEDEVLDWTSHSSDWIYE